MSINITRVMNKLYDRDYIDKIHRTIKEGLIGSLRNEYLTLHRVICEIVNDCEEAEIIERAAVNYLGGE